MPTTFTDLNMTFSAESAHPARHLLANTPMYTPTITHNMEATGIHESLFSGEFPFEYTYEVEPFAISYDIKDVAGTSESAILGLSQQGETFYPEFIEFSPTKIGNFNQTGGFYDIIVGEDITYLADRLSGVYILNTSIPSSPELLYVYHSPPNRGVWSLQKVDDHLFLGEASFSGGRAGALRALDVSDPSLPIEIGNYEVGDFVLDVAIDGTFAHVAASTRGYYIFDISDPATLTVMSIVPRSGGVYGVTVSGEHSYLITYNGNVYALDISNPTAPVVLSTTSFQAGYHIRSQGKYLFAGCLNYGLYILETSTSGIPEPIFNFNRGRSISKIHVEDNLLSLSDSSGFFVLDISDIYNPTSILSKIDTTNIRSTFITKNYLYVGGDKLDIYDMSQTTLVGRPATSDVNQYPMTLSIYDGEIKQFPFQLTVNQIPFQIGSIQDFSVLPGSALSEFVFLPIYFRDEDEGFYWSHLDCGNLNVAWDLQAKETHKIDLGCYTHDYHFLQEESIALVACGRGGFRIYDLLNPKKADLLFQHYNWPRNVLSFDYQANLAYVYEYHTNAGAQVYDYFLVTFDIQDPQAPLEISTFRLPDVHTKIRVFSRCAPWRLKAEAHSPR